MSWIAKEVMKKLELEEKELKTLRLEDDLWDIIVYELYNRITSKLLEEKLRIFKKINKRRKKVESKEFAGMLGVNKLFLIYSEGKGYTYGVNIYIIKPLDLPQLFKLLFILPIRLELEEKGYSIETYGHDTIPTMRITPKYDKRPIVANSIGLCFPIDYALHPKYSKIIDKTAKEVYGLSPPENYEK